MPEKEKTKLGFEFEQQIREQCERVKNTENPDFIWEKSFEWPEKDD